MHKLGAFVLSGHESRITISMTPERWQQINKILESALEHKSDERAVLLDRMCGDDISLRKEVESLLAAHDEAGGFLESLIFGAAAEMVSETGPGVESGQRIGPYKIISKIGKGGMGEVYLAQDSRLGRPVAIKLLPATFMTDDQRVRRFEQEARAAYPGPGYRDSDPGRGIGSNSRFG